MKNFDRKKHWNDIYSTKDLKDVSWFQPTPTHSFHLFKEFNIPTNSKIIDIGGGNSLFVDHLLDLGYQDITVLDISDSAIESAKKRLGKRAQNIQWIVADVTNFKPTQKYDLWHDRAAFHFLTEEEEISNYLQTAQQYINPEGLLIMGTFSEQGPKKCSGIDIKQYSEKTMCDLFKQFFTKINCITVDHKTPSGMAQNFIFCSFKKLIG